MSNSDEGVDAGISLELARFVADCEAVVRALVTAADGLSRLEELPAPSLLEQLERLRGGSKSLLERAQAVNVKLGDPALVSPGHDISLDRIVRFAREVVAKHEDQSARGAAVRELLDKVLRLAVTDDGELSALDDVRRRASSLIDRLRREAAPPIQSDVVELSRGAHPFCHLVRLVEKADLSHEERAESLVEVASLAKELAHAARTGRLKIGNSPPSESGLASDPEPPGSGGGGDESPVPVDGPSPEGPVDGLPCAPALEVPRDAPPVTIPPMPADSPAGTPPTPAVPPVGPSPSAVGERAPRSHVSDRQRRPLPRPASPLRMAAGPAEVAKDPAVVGSPAHLRMLLEEDRRSSSLPIRMTPPVILAPPAVSKVGRDVTPDSPASARPKPIGSIGLLEDALPAELRDFAAFRERHWIDSAGRCEAAPWISPHFAEELRERSILTLDRPCHLMLFARAAGRLGLEFPYRIEDVAALSSPLYSPLRSESGSADSGRGLRLLEAIRDGAVDDTPSWKLAVTLEALKPSGGLVPSSENADRLVDDAGFRHEPLRKVLKSLLALAACGTLRPLEQLRSALHAEAAPTTQQWLGRLRERREELRRLVDATHAPGARLKLTHCREAWGAFMEEGKEFFGALSNVADGASSPDPRYVKGEVKRLQSRYERIADRGGVKYEERQRMNRMVGSILKAAEGIGELAALAAEEPGSRASTLEPALIEAAVNLGGGGAPVDPAEGACLELVRRLIAGADVVAGVGETVLTVGDLASQPGLVALVPQEAVAEIVAGASSGEPVCRCDEVSDPLYAAALLLAGPASGPAAGEASGRHLAEAIHDQPERLVRLIRLLSDPQRAAARREIERLRDEAQERLNRLKGIRNDLDALVSRWAEPVGIVYESGQAMVDDPATESFTLVLGWLDRVLGSARSRRDAEVAALASRVDRLPEDEAGGRARSALAEGRYGDALHILGDPESESREDGRRLRETSYREPSRIRFPDPGRTIAEAADLATAELRAGWRTGINGHDDRKFRNDFLRFLCSKRSRRKAKASLEKEAKYENAESRLPTHAIRDRIAEFGLNPCYLPQLADYKELILLVPPTKVLSSKFVKATADEVARRGAGVFCAVLAPAVTPAARDALLKEFRDRKRVAAVIDDLDFCRLLNPGSEPPDPLIGFFEIFLEQQRWETLSPYSGRLVEKEMFVGRLDEAGDLKRTNKYSRLFSGRKLGKTSLLNHVLQTSGDDDERLPSGNVLRVLLITSVGPDAREVVDQVRSQLATRLGFTTSAAPTADDPADELVALTDAFIEARPGESLLVIIDEADSLFERELELYETKLERGLSFRMSREVEGKSRDSEGLPRVRFLFSGYRVTNKSEGVWANWGDVLRLTPLEPHDADNLAAGPLARMGIDLGDQTRVVSSRCGYQPAVLLRFGRELLAHLDRVHSPSRREYVKVSPDDVAQVLHRESVREEIRTVVRYNFIPGNRLGALVFEALLLEFHGVPPAAGLPEASKRVLDRLREIDPDTSWLLAREESAESEIERQIADFVERQLLTERYEGEDKVRTHRLRFPHHLAVLCPNEVDSDRKLREGIAAFRRGEAGIATGVRSLLSPRVMEDLRYVTGQAEHPDEPARAAVVASAWPAAVNHRSFGVPILLGYDADSTVEAGRVGDTSAPPTRRLAVLDAGPEAARRVLDGRAPALCRPLFTGGADLLRWAVRQGAHRDGGLDLISYELGRMGHATLDWWFSRVRRLGLPPGLDPIGLVHRATGGIPLLVGHFDRALLDRDFGAEDSAKEDVPQSDFVHALNRCREDLPTLAGLLREGPPALRLEPREIQLLAMVAQVCRGLGESCTSKDLIFGLSEGWTEFFRRDDLRDLPSVDDDGDQAALAVLQGLGYLRFSPERPASYPLGRLESLPPEDPLMGLVDALYRGPAR